MPKKLSDSFLRNQAFNWKVDDGWTTTDESALEKLRCLSAGGAKNKKKLNVRVRPPNT